MTDPNQVLHQLQMALGQAFVAGLRLDPEGMRTLFRWINHVETHHHLVPMPVSNLAVEALLQHHGPLRQAIIMAFRSGVVRQDNLPDFHARIETLIDLHWGYPSRYLATVQNQNPFASQGTTSTRDTPLTNIDPRLRPVPTVNPSPVPKSRSVPQNKTTASTISKPTKSLAKKTNTKHQGLRYECDMPCNQKNKKQHCKYSTTRDFNRHMREHKLHKGKRDGFQVTNTDEKQMTWSAQDKNGKVYTGNMVAAEDDDTEDEEDDKQAEDKQDKDKQK